MDVLAGIWSEQKGLYYSGTADVASEYQCYAHTCCGSIVDNNNHNLSGPQKELLLWNWKTGAGMHWVQRMMHPTTLKDEHGHETTLPPVITPHFKSTPNCPVPKCMACQLACAK